MPLNFIAYLRDGEQGEGVKVWVDRYLLAYGSIVRIIRGIAPPPPHPLPLGFLHLPYSFMILKLGNCCGIELEDGCVIGLTLLAFRKLHLFIQFKL